MLTNNNDNHDNNDNDDENNDNNYNDDNSDNCATFGIPRNSRYEWVLTKRGLGRGPFDLERRNDSIPSLKMVMMMAV